MAFIDEQEARTDTSTTSFVRKLSSWVKLEENKPVYVQIMDSKAAEYWKYWFKDSQGKWVGYTSPGYETCPINMRNRELGKEHPKYIKPQKKYAVNVIDHTKYYSCPECSKMYAVYEKPDACTCGYRWTDNDTAEPLHMVRVLERGVTLFSQFQTLADGNKVIDEEGNWTGEWTGPSVHDADGNPLQIHQYVVQIVLTDRQKGSCTVTPRLDIPALPLWEFEAVKHDLPVMSDLTNDEIGLILDQGVPIRDIYAARRQEESDAELDAVEAIESSEVEKQEFLY